MPDPPVPRLGLVVVYTDGNSEQKAAMIVRAYPDAPLTVDLCVFEPQPNLGTTSPAQYVRYNANGEPDTWL